MENNNENKRGRGRPRIETTMNAEWYKIIIESGRQGKHITDFLIQLGISWQGHYDLLKRNLKYYQAVEEYNKLCENYWDEMGLSAMERNGGVGFNSRLWSLVLRNKFGNNWSEKTEVDVTSQGQRINDPKPIQIEIIKPNSLEDN